MCFTEQEILALLDTGSEEKKLEQLSNKTRQLKSQSNGTKLLFSVGGSDHPSEPFSRLVANETHRKNFIKHSIGFLKKAGFDGLDLFWYSPVWWTVGDTTSHIGHEQDKPNFQQFIEELSAAYRREELLLTLEVSALIEVMNKAFNLEALSKHVDQIHMVSWDLAGYWSGQTNYGNPITTFDSSCYALVRVSLSNWAIEPGYF